MSDQQEYSFKQHEFNGRRADETAINRPTASGQAATATTTALLLSVVRSLDRPAANAAVATPVPVICSLLGRENTCTFAVLYNIKRTK